MYIKKAHSTTCISKKTMQQIEPGVRLHKTKTHRKTIRMATPIAPQVAKVNTQPTAERPPETSGKIQQTVKQQRGKGERARR